MTTIGNNTLDLVVKNALPALSGSPLTYNAQKNVFLTLGYTSAAGNTYYKAIRLSKRLAVYYDIGEGYCHTFLNGITLFAWNGEKAVIIARRCWGGSSWRVFTEDGAREESIQMLQDFLKAQVKMLGRYVDDRQLLDVSRQMITETQQRQLN